MKFSRTNSVSAFISFIVVVVFIIIFTITSYGIYGKLFWWSLFLCSAGIYITAFISAKYSVEKFIYEKIRPIYKTIYNQKAPEEKNKQQGDTEPDTISTVNQQVMQWVEDNKEEIEQLKKMEAYRREFLGNVSHELKTPIFNIQGYILTLLEGGLDDPSINKEFLLRTEKSINRMINIVQDLETISRLETGNITPVMTRFDICALTKDVFEFLELSAKASNIQLGFDKDYDKAIYVRADKEKIRQVLSNLIDNSIKYGNVNGHTRISFLDMDERVLIEVTDDGIGVEQKEIPRLFERFYRVDKSRSREQGGTGLGLSIVKHIIEAHQQTINVRSTVGAGTTFAFTLKKG